MFQRLPRLGRALLMIVGLAALGGAPASAGWICLPPAFCAVPWLFAIGTVVQNIQPPDDDSGSDIPPLCLTDPVPLTVWAEPLRKEVQTNQSVTVRIYGSFDSPVVAFGFHLDYDDALLDFQQLTLASAFRPLDSEYAAGVAGLAYPVGVSGDRVLLATARFTSQAVGEAEIGMAVAANDPREGFAMLGCGKGEATLTPASITIVEREVPPRPRPPIPEPASGLCLLAALGWMRRRKAR